MKVASDCTPYIYIYIYIVMVIVIYIIDNKFNKYFMLVPF